MNLPFPRNDRTATEVKASGAFSASYDFTSALTDVSDYQDICFVVVVTNKGTNTTLTLKAQTNLHESSPSVWSDLQSDDKISSGVAPLNIYEGVFDISALTPPFTLHFNVPRRGRHMRLGIKGTAADGAYSVSTLKNVR
jgi:hypothetical protein